ncbi:MAG TPA: hypothetical protein VMZ53_14545 [Kofleriaceae bacterium]|nr:hypothetical protein [Kofleriaceae bacterium]
MWRACVALTISGCSLISVRVPDQRQPDRECTYKMPIIDTVFAVSAIAGDLVYVATSKPQGGFVDMRPVFIAIPLIVAGVDAASAIYGFVEERRCYRLPPAA